jgi:asparagine synthase (glutamine-hydrolysing)
MNLKKVVNLFEELRLLGFEGSLFRIYYEFTLRTGLKKIFSSKIPKVRVNVTLDEWRKNKSKCFLPSLEEAKSLLNSILDDGNKAEIIKIANEITKGSITCFSKWAGDYKDPIDWHYNPKRKVSWPTDVHWSKVMQFEKSCGDVKLTWEVNRFTHLYHLVRGYVLTIDSNYVKAFSQQLKYWEEANPYGFGVNWNSGQELAIRVLSWIYALYMMGDNNNLKDGDFQRLLKLLYLHALHIEKNIKYAYYAVHNNHLLGEALGLYAIGTLFPYFSESIRWRNKGKAILESEKCLKQFYEDGGYCQLSFNYQRLVLHYYLWALRIAEVNGDRFMGEILNMSDRSAKFLYSFINLKDGKLPNWGANDGALLNPWTSCDYSDYRPLINSLSYITRKKRAFPEGSWDEELFWFFGTEALEANVESYQLKSQSSPVTGLHILRGDNDTFATFRCGSVTDRFSQADQLHVDVWWNGLNIAIDGGSYLYNDELEYHRYFMGTSSHNTVIVNGEDQMLLFRRFKWLYWTKAKLLNFSGNIAEGEHYGYGRLEANILHNRKVRMIDNRSFLIIDQLTQKKGDYVHYDLHWLLNDFKYKIEQLNGNSFKMVLFTPKGKYYIFISSDVESRLLINRALEDKNKPDGWQSRYYGEKTPALSLHFICDFNKGVRFLTFFTGKEGDFGYLEEIIRGENVHTLNS